ncbi:retinol dehydrogenase 7-like [Littorina saxatilis]|uniref:Estradiol 17-beta-dehydrogenase 2 n=1 Tax=Littorina saxatilis TaxID=31220 RepID=A0AAN9BNI3_9CAEN
MDVHQTALLLGAYTGFVTLGIIRRSVRLTHQPLLDLLKLGAVAAVLSLLCCGPVAAVVVAVVAFCLYHSLPSPQLPAEGKAVFITGCDRGLGQLLAIHLDSRGVQVFAGCLFPGGEGEATLKSKCSERLRTVPLDVSEPGKVKEAAEIVKKELQGKELWGVVNNAGMCYIGCLEVMAEQDVRRLVEVNFMGQVHVTRAFLPLLRHSHGRLVNVASNTGLAPVPFHMAYCASKAAVACMSESLRLELSLLDIKVSTIIPSGYRTGILQYDSTAAGDRWWTTANKEIQDSYGRDSFYPENKTKDYRSILNPDFSGIVYKMTDALLEKHPQAFYYKGLLARSLPFLYLHTPTCIADLFYPTFVTWYNFHPPCMKKQDGKKAQ